jgi:hypothetical protein
LDCLVVPWHQGDVPGRLAAFLWDQTRWESPVAGARSPTQPQWLPLDGQSGYAGGELDGGDLRALILVTSQETLTGPDGAYTGEATVAGAGDAAGAATRLAQAHGVHRLGMPLIGAGWASLPPSPVADAVVSATRFATTSSGLAALTDVVFIVPDPEFLDWISAAWAGFRTQGFANDRPEGPDLLGIRDEVHALADMLLLREVTPPLAVGILGGWGSGKSFVLHLLRERMVEIRSDVIEEDQAWSQGRPPPFVGHVYPIEFNAWTYARADLWAALMQCVLTELDRQIGIEHRLAEQGRLLDGPEWRRLVSTPAELQKLYDALPDAGVPGQSLFQALSNVHRADRERLASASQELETLRTEADARVSEIEGDVDRALVAEIEGKVQQEALAPLAAAVDVASSEVWRWATHQVPELGTAGDATLTTLDELRALESELPRLTPPPSALLRSGWKTRRSSLIALGVVLVLAGAVAVWGAELVGLLAGATTVLTTLVVWLGAGRAALARFRQATDQAQARVAEEIRALEASKPEEVEQKRRSDPALQTTERQIAEAEARVELLKDRVGLVGRYQSVDDLVRDRLERGTYAERLGVMQQVSDDLASLTSSLLIADADLHEEAKKKLFPRGPARVVLFIDDLDRCPPRKVVEVLEAVQLLLSTNLFVVVLALDVRYVTKSLEKVYAGVLSADGDPSGLDYLEKIIQIPYRTRRPSGDGALQFMAGQLRVEEPERGEAGSFAESADLPAGEGAPTPAASIDSELVERELLFTRDDLASVAACCTLLELTPRSAKRVSNALKLFRLVWARRGRDRPSLQDITTVAMIVGLAAAHPEVQRDALAVLEQQLAGPGPSQAKLVEVLGQLTPPDGPPEHPEVQRYRRWKVSLDAFDRLEVPLADAETPSLRVGDITVDESRSVVQFTTAFCFVGDDLPRLGAESTSGPPT